MTDARLAVSAAVKTVLDTEAKRNELRVAIVRFAGFAAVLCIDGVTAATGLRPVDNIPQSLACTTVALAILVALRRAPFQDWYKYVIPAIDLGLLAWLLTDRLSDLGAGVGLTATSALVCALFSVTGALRFQRRSALWATALSGGLLVLLLGPHAEVHELVYSAVALASVGLLAMWLADMVRRSMEGAGSQALLQRFLPRELVESAFSDPLAAFGEARVVDATVLVSDIRGFTTMAERLPPDRVFAFLSKLQGELARIVRNHGGIVDKFLGDGMLAVFGVDGKPDHAERALAAASQIQAALHELGGAEPLGGPLRIGIGLHSGPLVAGCLGDGDRLEWTIIGDTVNTASRLESMTKERGVAVLASEAVVARAGEAGLVPLGAVPVRGREQALAIYTLEQVRQQSDVA